MQCRGALLYNYGMEKRLADRVRETVLREYIAPAASRGDKSITVTAGDVAKSMKLKDRTPAICAALLSKALLEEGHLALESRTGPPSGIGTRAQYTYRIVDRAGTEAISGLDGARERFNSLRGAGRVVYGELGGGAKYMESERADFHGA
jgi:hypothetical protein